MKWAVGWLIGCFAGVFWVAAAVAAPRLWVESAVLEAPPYVVNAQLTVRVRWWQAVDARIEALELQDIRLAEVVPLGALRSAEAVRDGMRYRRIERDFAVLPFASGPLDVTALARGDSPAGHPETKGLRRWVVSAPPLVIDVAPALTTGWLPVRQLAMRWQGEWTPWDATVGSQPAVGATARRVLVVEAEGVDAGLVPDPEWRADGVRWRVLSAQRRREVDAATGVVRAHLILTIEATLVQPGAVTLPHARMVGWDARRGMPVAVSVSAQSLSVVEDGREQAVERSGQINVAGVVSAAVTTMLLVMVWPGLGRVVRVVWAVIRDRPDRARRHFLMFALVPAELDAAVFGPRTVSWRRAACQTLAKTLFRRSFWRWRVGATLAPDETPRRYKR